MWKIGNINNKKIQILKQECGKNSDTLFQQLIDIKQRGKKNYHKNLKTYQTLTRFSCMDPDLKQLYKNLLLFNKY